MTADPVTVLVVAAVTLAVVSFLAGWMADEYSWSTGCGASRP
jgi:hypothetical protein